MKQHTRKIRKTKNKRKTIYGGSARRSPSRSRSPASRGGHSRSAGVGRAAAEGASYSTVATFMQALGYGNSRPSRRDEIAEKVPLMWIAFIQYLHINLHYISRKFTEDIVYELENKLMKDTSTDQQSKFDLMQQVFDKHKIEIDVEREHEHFLDDKKPSIDKAKERYPYEKRG